MPLFPDPRFRPLAERSSGTRASCCKCGESVVEDKHPRKILSGVLTIYIGQHDGFGHSVTELKRCCATCTQVVSDGLRELLGAELTAFRGK